MGELTVIEEMPVTNTQVKEKLVLLEKEKPLSFRGEKTKEYLSSFVKLAPKETEEFVKKIQDLNIPRLKDRHITKIIDVLPKDLDSIRILLSGETITIKEEDMKRILDVIPQ